MIILIYLFEKIIRIVSEQAPPSCHLYLKYELVNLQCLHILLNMFCFCC